LHLTTDADRGSGSLRERIGDANCDTINFASDYRMTLSSGRPIGWNVTIDGTGRTSSSMVPVSCTTCFRVFDIAGGNITLNRLNISKGYMTVGNDQKPQAI
jgi:hypothetical protein